MPNAIERRPTGRGPKGMMKLNDELLHAFVGCIKVGAKMDTACKICGVSPSTVDRWMTAGIKAPFDSVLNRFYREVNMAVGKIDIRLERSMLSAALRKRKKKKIVTKEIVDAQTGQITHYETTTTEEEILPDAAMALRILQQRRPRDYNQAAIEAHFDEEDAIPIELIFGVKRPVEKKKEPGDVVDVDPEDVVEV